jgi:hypothetical protein
MARQNKHRALGPQGGPGPKTTQGRPARQGPARRINPKNTKVSGATRRYGR